MKTSIQLSPVNVEHRKSLDIRPGDTVRVWTKVEEKGKTRKQAFEGLVLARKHGKEPGATFTVRKVASGVGVEKIFPLYSPNITEIELVRRSKVRRSKLYYIREKAAKEIRRKMKGIAKDIPDFSEEEVIEEEVQGEAEKENEEVSGEIKEEKTEEKQEDAEEGKKEN